MGYGGVLQVGVDLFDDGVTAVGFVRGDGVQVAAFGGGEERVEASGVEQGGLPGAGVVVQVEDAADHQPAGDLLGHLLGGERGEWDLGDLRPETHVPVASSKTASVYSIVLHASASMLAIAALTFVVSRTVTDTLAPARSAAARVGRP